MTSDGRKFEKEGALPAVSPALLAEMVAAACDLTLVASNEGEIATVICNPRADFCRMVEDWRGRHLRDVFAAESWAKLESRIGPKAIGRNSSDAVELNHVAGAGGEFPVHYVITPIETGGVLMVGRDLRPMEAVQQQLVNAQLALERDYESQREMEARYRVVMEMSGSPIVLISMASGRIVDANSQAEILMGASRGDLVGSSAAQEFDGRRRGELLESLTVLSGADPEEDVVLTVRRTKRRVAVRINMFRSAGEKLLLCQFDPADGDRVQTDRLGELMNRLYHRGVDSIVFLDEQGTIRFANEAFLNLTDSKRRAQVVGRSFADFMARGVVDLRVLLENVKRIGHMRHYSSRLNTDYSGQVSVEISAVHFDEQSRSAIALVIRDVSALDGVRWAQSIPGNEGLRNVLQLIGYSALRDIVSETTEIIEKMCIEAALELTGNNRVAAAELLSLSRQSLYVKLRKFGLLDKQG